MNRLTYSLHRTLRPPLNVIARLKVVTSSSSTQEFVAFPDPALLPLR